MSIKAMKLALEALESASPAAWASRVDSDTMKSIWRKHAEALEGLQVLIAELDNTACKSVQKRLEAQQPATRLPEDVVIGHVTLCKGSNISLLIDHAKRLNADVERLEAQQPAMGEPVAYVDRDGFIIETGLLLAPGTKLYTTPQPAQATQAGVTDSMIREAFLANGFTIKDGHGDLKPYVYAAARAILSLRPAAVPSVPADVVLDCYDAGILNDFGGGNVEWWQDYIRAELGNAHDFYQSQIAHHGASHWGTSHEHKT